VIGVTSTQLSPARAIAYLRELQPAAREVAVLAPGGALLAGAQGACAELGRSLQRVGGERLAAGGVVAVAAGGYVVVARLAPDSDVLAEFDLRGVASALDVRVRDTMDGGIGVVGRGRPRPDSGRSNRGSTARPEGGS